MNVSFLRTNFNWRIDLNPNPAPPTLNKPSVFRTSLEESAQALETRQLRLVTMFTDVSPISLYGPFRYACNRL